MQIQKQIQRLICLIFIGTMIILALKGKWDRQLVLASGALMTLFFQVLGKKWRVHIPDNGLLASVLFVFSAQYLGTFLGFYSLLSWWDIALHFVSGFLLAYWGLIFIAALDDRQLLYRERKISLFVLISFLTAVASAGLWEMVEFLGDIFLGTNAQLGSLTDTMEDIICGTIGGGLFAIYIGIMLKNKRKCLVDHLFSMNLSGKKHHREAKRKRK